MRVDHIVIDKNFTSVPNELLTSNRLKKYQILLAVLLNLRNMRLVRKVDNPNEIIISKKELRSVLGFCSESAIEKQLDELKALDIVTVFSKVGGEDGSFNVTLVENLKDNPYVLLDVVEKQIIKECHVTAEKGSKKTLSKLFNLIEGIRHSAEHDYVRKLAQGTKALEEYKSHLKSVILEAGLGTFAETKQLERNDQSRQPYRKSVKAFPSLSVAKKQEQAHVVQENLGIDEGEFLKRLVERRNARNDTRITDLRKERY